ncbi:hypothetical protein F4679DRAFT_548475, partial [Xylaria curta]
MGDQQAKPLALLSLCRPISSLAQASSIYVFELCHMLLRNPEPRDVHTYYSDVPPTNERAVFPRSKSIVRI